MYIYNYFNVIEENTRAVQTQRVTQAHRHTQSRKKAYKKKEVSFRLLPIAQNKQKFPTMGSPPCYQLIRT